MVTITTQNPNINILPNLSLSEKISKARYAGYNDRQIYFTLNQSNLSGNMAKARKAGYNQTQILNTLANVKNPELLTTQTTAQQKQNWFKTLIKEEVGAVSTIAAPFFLKGAAREKDQEAKDMQKYMTLYKNTPEGPVKERRRKVLDKYLKKEPERWEQIVPGIDKTPSQALGEAIMLGLLITPIPEVKALLKAKGITKTAAKALTKTAQKSYLRKGLSGAAIGSAFGGALGLAQPGEFKEKLPTIAAMAGLGGLAGGVLTGVLPPLLSASNKGMKKVFSKVFKGSAIENKIILPVVRQVKRTVAKATIKKRAIALEKGYTKVKNKIAVLTKKSNAIEEQTKKLLITIKKYEGAELPKIFNAVLKKVQNTRTFKTFKASLSQNEIAFLEEEGVKAFDFWRRAKSAVKRGKLKQQLIVKQEGRLTQLTELQKKVAKLEKEKEKLFQQSVLKGLNQGDTIYNENIGRVKVKSFMSDELGRTVILGEDVNGKIVTLLEDDLVKMRKIVAPKERLITEFAGLPKIPETPVEKGKFSDLMLGLKGWAKTSGEVLKEFGEAGKMLSQLLDNVLDEAPRRANMLKAPMRELIRKLGLSKKGQNLTNKEIKNIVEILESGYKLKATSFDDIPLKAINPRVKEFLDTFWKITKQVLDEAREAGITIRDKTTGKKYPMGEAHIHFPHILKDVEKFEKNKAKLINTISKRQDLTPKQANALVNDFTKQFSSNRYAGLEQRRTFKIAGFDELEKYGYETHPLVALSDFVGGASKRIAEVKSFGANDGLVAQLLHIIKESGYDDGMARAIWNRYKGAETFKSERNITTFIKKYQTIAKLPLSAIINSTQVINTATEFGVKGFIRGLKKFMRDKLGAREAAKLSGVTDETIRRAIEMAAGAETETAQKFLRSVGFTQVEKWNRIITVVTSQEWAKDSLKRLLKTYDPTRANVQELNQRILRHFKKLGIDNIKDVLNRGHFSAEQLNIIGQKAVKSSQFRGAALDIPLYWSSPWGKVLTQFKTFAWQQGRFIKNTIIDELQHGNVAPLLTYLVLSEITGEAVRDIRTLLKGDLTFRKDMSLLDRSIENIFSVAGFGLAGDLFERMFRIAKGDYWISISDMLMGPTVGDIVQFADSFSAAIGGNFKAFTKFSSRQAALLSLIPKLRDIPGAGAILRILADVMATITTSDD